MKKIHVIVSTSLVGLLVFIATLPTLLKQNAEEVIPQEQSYTQTEEPTQEQEYVSPTEQVKQLNIKSLPSSPSDHYKTHPDTPRPDYVKLAPSLRDTDIDGRFATDADNNLTLSIGVRDTFDYFLNTIGEVSPETAISEIKALVNASLPEPAKSQAITALEDYLTYKAATLEILSRPLDTNIQQTPEQQYQILERSLGQLQQLRQQYLSPELNSAFYAEEDAFAQYSLGTMKVQMDNSLTAQEKTQALLLLEEELPETIKTSMQEMANAQSVAKDAESLYESGNRDAYENHLREHYSEDIVRKSLEDFDQQQAFDQTYTTYRDALSQYDVSDLSEEALETLQANIRNQYFEGHDRLIAKTRDDLQKL